MHAAVVLGLPLVALATPFVLGTLRRVRAERRAALLEALALAARRGVPLAAPLRRAATVAKPSRAAALGALAADLDAGRPLAEALRARLPREVPASVAAALAAGERASRLPQALEHAAADASRDLAAGHRVALAAFYPGLLFVGLALLHTRLLEGRLEGIRAEAAADLGAATGAVVVVRAALVAVGLAAVLLPIVRRLRPRVDGAASARFLRGVALQVDAGRPLHAALAEGADAAGVARLARAARGAGARVAAGEPAAEAWRALPLPRAARERLAVAPPAGLARLLPEVADACDAREARRVERFVAWAVPAATLAAGLLVALDYAVLTDVMNAVRDTARPW
ncbi:MAG: type II secretion system F family protein [Planctomycetota bacterium]